MKKNNKWIWLVITYFFMIIVGIILSAYSNQSGESLFVNFALFVIVGIIFFNACKRFILVKKMSDDLVNATKKIQAEFDEKKNYLWQFHKTSGENLFATDELKQAYTSFYNEINRLDRATNGSYKCTIEDYINKELIDSYVRKNIYNLVPGAMTGFGILGTFIGLSFGLREFNTGSVAEIAASIAPLMDGIKVAFHTSIYGMVFSLVFNYVYKQSTESIYINLDNFLDIYTRYVMTDAENDNDSNIQKRLNTIPDDVANKLGQVLSPSFNSLNDTLKEYTTNIGKIQMEGMSSIVNSFVSQMNAALGDNFTRLGQILEQVCEQQEKQNKIVDVMTRALKESSVSLMSIQNVTKETVEAMSKYVADVEKLQSEINKDVMSISIQMESQQQLNEEVKNCVADLIEKETRMADVTAQTVEKVGHIDETFLDFQKTIAETNQEALENIYETAKEFESEIAESAKKQIEQITNLSNRSANDMLEASKQLSSVTSTLNKSLDESLQRTFDSFDSNLADISMHLSGTLSGLDTTLSEIDDTTGRIPKAIVQGYEEMQKTFEDLRNTLNTVQSTTNDNVES